MESFQVKQLEALALELHMADRYRSTAEAPNKDSFDWQDWLTKTLRYVPKRHQDIYKPPPEQHAQAT